MNRRVTRLTSVIMAALFMMTTHGHVLMAQPAGR